MSTTARPEPKAATSGISAALDLARKFKSAPWGAGLGVVLASLALWLWPELEPEGWGRWSFVGVAAAGGVVLQRFLSWSVGRFVDPWLGHLAAEWEARLELRKLDRYQRSGLIRQPEVERMANRIARRNVAGGFKQRGPRAPYRRRRKGLPPATGGSPSETPPTPT